MATPLYRSNLSPQQISQLYKDQQDFFRMGKTFDISFRRKTLKHLKQVLKENEAELLKALAADLRKPEFEAYASEIGFVYAEINHTLKNLRAWTKPKSVTSPISTWPSRSYVIPQPKGVCLIIAPWNYPFMLLVSPLIAALAAGNTAFLKPAEQTPHTSNLLCQILTENFDQELITVIQGEGQTTIPPLLKAHRFDHIFFTGSTSVGRSIALLAAEKLSPITLELGGKSPAVIDRTAKLSVAAQRIAFGKWLNAGQTCVAPDYLLVQREVRDEFLALLKASIQSFYPHGALNSADYTSIIHQKHFETICSYLQSGTLYFGGETDAQQLRIAPTILVDPDLESPVMNTEIFGPILPVLTFDFIEEAREIIDRNPNPLAFYLYSSDKANQAYWKKMPFGGGAINNSVVHLANLELPFGGIGNSGQGAYHGKYGFDTFSHPKAIIKSGTWLDLKQKYPPYSNFALQIIRRLMS